MLRERERERGREGERGRESACVYVYNMYKYYIYLYNILGPEHLGGKMVLTSTFDDPIAGLVVGAYRQVSLSFKKNGI